VKVSFENTSTPFMTNWARLGPFLTSFARNKLSRFLEQRINEVVWAHTDGFIMKSELKTDIAFDSTKLHSLKYEGMREHMKIDNMRPSGLKDFIL